jgi:prefoldin subunit 5
MTVETPGAEPSAELEEEVPSEDPESQMEVIPPGEAVAEQGMPLDRESEEADLEDAPARTEEAEGEAVAETEDQPVEEAGLYDVEAIPPGESFAEQGMPLEQEAREADVEDAPAETEEPEGETALKTEEEPEGEAALKTEEESVAAEDALEAEEELVEEKPVEDDLSTVSLPPRSEAPSPRSRRRLSWLWTALLGAILGMIFTLVVFAGINGSLDVGHSRAVLRIESGLDGLTADVQTLETDVEGLRRRLNTIEGLTSRMDDVESAVSGLRQETSDLSERTAALESEFVDVSEDLQQVSETVVSLQDQAERTQGFFSGLQLLMSDIFGSADGASASTPTPEGK